MIHINKTGGNKMRRKMMMLLVTIGIIPVLLLSIFSYWQLTSTMHEDANRIGLARVQLLKLDVNSLLQKNMQEIKLIANMPAVKNMDIPAIKQVLTNSGKVNADLSVISVIDKQGKQVVKNDTSPLVDVSDRPFYQQVIKGQDDFISDVIISKSNGNPMVILSTPIKNDAGEIVGVLPAAIDLSVLSKFVSDRSQNGDIAYIVDKEGKMLAHPDTKLVSERTDLHESDYIKQALSGKSDTIKATGTDGVQKMVSYITDPYTGWTICIEKSADEYLSQVEKLILINAIIVALTIIIVVGIGYFFAGRTVKPLLGLLAASNEIKNGNLVVTIEKGAQDESGLLAENFSSMVASLRQLVHKIAESAEYLAASSEELTASSEQSAKAASQVSGATTIVAQDAIEQARVAKEMNGTFIRISDDINNAVTGALQASQSAEKSAVTASSGGEQIKTAITQMASIEKAVSDSAVVVAELGQRSQEIGQIINTITSIAAQTNLLALNAAIEAARAGEAGRGFAVVAEEVRKLAEQSGVAASQIAELISSIQTDTNRAVNTMQYGTTEVQTGASIIKSTGESFYEIVSLVNEVSQQVATSYELMKKVVTSSKELQQAMTQIDSLSAKTAKQSETILATSQDQSATMEDISISSQSLASTAEELSGLINHFKYN